MRLAVLHSGALHASTLPLLRCAVCTAQRLAASWTAPLDAVHVAVYWKTQNATFALRDDAARCPTFHAERALEWTQRPANATHVRPHNVRMAWRALRAGVDAALALHAHWIFRVRFDAHVVQWGDAHFRAREWSPACVYTFVTSFGWPSDNVLLFRASEGRALFAADSADESAEKGIVIAGAARGLRLCWLPADVWLVKPDAGTFDARESSVGVRHWFPSAAVEAGTTNASVPARQFRPGMQPHLNARHAAYARFALVPAPMRRRLRCRS
jgi:hypothetical protein